MGPREIDLGHVYMAQALPTPTDTPYRTPLGPLSRQSSHYGSSTPPPSSSPPPLPPSSGPFQNHDAAKDEGISLLDPRRFTPTLHASLVSEILSLRRDLDSRNDFIGQLERNLETTRTDYDDSNRTLLSTSKEVRSLRRQLQLLEGGTASALGELSKERDEAVDSLADVKRRLETSQKKARVEEENANRIQRHWDRDKQKWEEQRRNMERKVHIVEGRLKAILEEVAVQQAVTQACNVEHHTDVAGDGRETPIETNFPRSSHSPVKRSIRRKGNRPLSVTSVDSVRLSMLNAPSGVVGSIHPGLSLADELGMEAELEHRDEVDEHGTGARSDVQKAMNGLNQQSTSVMEDKVTFVGTIREVEANPSHEVVLNTEHAAGQDEVFLNRTIKYMDSGSQFSPPPSPTMRTVLPESLPSSKLDDRASSPADHEANQGRKRVGTNRNSLLAPAESLAVMVSSSCQTLEFPSDQSLGCLSSSPQLALPTLRSVATQTDPLPTSEPNREPTPPPQLVNIPSIAIHPPKPAPVNSGPSVLPPRTKNAACQVSANRLIKFRSIAVQTEGIRIDKRAVKLPPHLLPSSISSTPPSPELASQSRTGRKPKSPPKKHAKKPLKAWGSNHIPSSPPCPITFEQGNLHDLDHADHVNLPLRSGGLFTDFDIPSSDEGDDFAEVELSEADFRTALSAPRPRTESRRSSAPAPRPAGPLVNGKVSGGALNQVQRQHLKGSNGNITTSRTELSGGTRTCTVKPQRAGGLSNGKFGMAKLGRRSPSKLGAENTRSVRSGSPIKRGTGNKSDTPPPFPVPMRSSSKWLSNSTSDGTRSPSRRGVNLFGGNRRRESGRLADANENLRKVRSATTIRRGPSSRSPPPPPPPFVLDSPPLHEGLTTPHPSRTYHHSAYSHQPSSNTTYTHGPAPESAGAQKEIVDAIAQTMVGEWMWKYVRRRKSFGVTESAPNEFGDDTSNGVRHKRWVWLSPYERAVLWSNKQPTTDTALLGKSGRKLIMQSVLDVRDETPGPKSSGQLFNRSILILTTARALKFTASSKESHYVWITALSFLCRPSIGNDDLIMLPPAASEDFPAAGFRRNPIRDSIRVAKGKARARSNKAAVAEDPTGAGGAISVSAEAPSIPRFSKHGRHRSNTGGRPPMGGLRSFTQPIINPSLTNVSSTIYDQGPSPCYVPRTSHASSGSSLATSHFLRMEAFVGGATPLHLDRSGAGLPISPHDKRLGGDARAIRTESHQHPPQLGHRSDGADEFFRIDPFRGF
ncbi:MAG: hypothetical protein M1816_002481 [Peltula sp. TS41687]|nr:MAG: hypothetical protein M1816_002481 [Peltula sp. TS41687]